MEKSRRFCYNIGNSTQIKAFWLLIPGIIQFNILRPWLTAETKLSRIKPQLKEDHRMFRFLQEKRLIPPQCRPRHKKLVISNEAFFGQYTTFWSSCHYRPCRAVRLYSFILGVWIQTQSIWNRCVTGVQPQVWETDGSLYPLTNCGLA